MGLRFFPVLLLPLASLAAAQERSLPSDVELHAAYCIPVLQHSVAMVQRQKLEPTKRQAS